MTSKNKRGTVQRMIETLRMWRMCRLLAENRFAFLMEILDEDKSSFAEVQHPEVKRLFKAAESCHEPRAKREALCFKYINTYSDIAGKEVSIADGKVGRYLAEAQSIIGSCLDEEYGYMKPQSINPRHVYLTAKGKKFVGYDGLCKAWISDIGSLWTVFGTGLVSILGTTNWHLIVWVTGMISPWW